MKDNESRLLKSHINKLKSHNLGRIKDRAKELKRLL